MIPTASRSSRGTSVRVFLEDGTPDGMRSVTKSNWTGLAMMCSRSQYLNVRTRDEFGRPGVYVLIGDSLDGTSQRRIYIGQADDARERLDSHSKTKDFWTQLILFTSRDEYFNRAHAQYVESRLIRLAMTAKLYELENANAPRTPALSSADQADAESFLTDMLVIYPLLGIHAFEVIESKSIEVVVGPDGKVSTNRSSRSERISETLYIDSSGTTAEGLDTPQAFQVLAGARARRETVDSVPPYVVTIRQQLLTDGVLVDRGTFLELTQDYPFSSPSQAAAVMMGRSANGRTEWHDASGQSLKTLQLAALSASKRDEPGEQDDEELESQ